MPGGQESPREFDANIDLPRHESGLAPITYQSMHDTQSVHNNQCTTISTKPQSVDNNQQPASKNGLCLLGVCINKHSMQGERVLFGYFFAMFGRTRAIQQSIA